MFGEKEKAIKKSFFKSVLTVSRTVDDDNAAAQYGDLDEAMTRMTRLVQQSNFR